jgi:hypothetical protein
MIDVSAVTDRLPSASGLSRVRIAVLRWVPGLREDAPKRNFVLLIAYAELLLIGLSLLRYLL